MLNYEKSIYNTIPYEEENCKKKENIEDKIEFEKKVYLSLIAKYEKGLKLSKDGIYKIKNYVSKREREIENSNK